MKWFTITELSDKLHISRDEAYRRLFNVGVIGGYPESHYITEAGKEVAQDKWVENDRYGRSYWVQVFASSVMDMIRKP